MFQADPKPQPRDWRLATQLWLLTAAINYIEAQEPGTHHGPEMVALWPEVKQEVLTELRREMSTWTQFHGERPRTPREKPL